MSKNRNVLLINGEYYHIYNRGVDKRIVFLDEEDYWKFFDDLRDFNNDSAYEERLSALGISKDSPKPLSGFSNLLVLSSLEDIVLPQFKNESEFKNFVKQVIFESRLKKEMKKYLLEDF